MTPDPFRSPSAYREAFARGLERLLEGSGPGPFILVLANASHDPALWQALWPRLDRRFNELGDALVDALRHGRRLAHPQDDLLVFFELMALGLGRVTLTRYRRVGPWALQYNPLRALRPARMSHTPVTELHAPFDAGGFHFNRPFLQTECLWQGELLGRPVRLFYNKFPFAPGHALLVPDPDAGRPQWLDRDTHHLAWRWLEQIGPQLPGSGLGYNSRGAGASVNHLHLQFYTGHQAGHPIEAPLWRHNGGDRAWPLPAQRFACAETAWKAIEACHRHGRPYNLLYRPGRLYLTPRAWQGQPPGPAWTQGLAWAECAGTFTLSCEDDFQRLEAEEPEAALAGIAP